LVSFTLIFSYMMFHVCRSSYRKEKGKSTDIGWKEGQEDKFQAKEEADWIQRIGMGTSCHEARSCDAKIPAVEI